jgi:hypothetical protein
MRQNGLGRFEWIEEAKEKSKKGKKWMHVLFVKD